MALAILFLTLSRANSNSALQSLLARLGIDLEEATQNLAEADPGPSDEDPSWNYHELDGPDYVLDTESGEATVHHEGASAIKVHLALSGLEDCPAVALKVSSEDGSESYAYDGSDFNEADCDGVGDACVFAMSISSDTVVVSWGEFEECGSDLEARVDGYLVEDSETRRSEETRRRSKGLPDGICGDEFDMIDRACAEEDFTKNGFSTHLNDFKNADPVAMLNMVLGPGRTYTCTAFKLNGDYALTSAHCCPEYDYGARPSMYHNADPAPGGTADPNAAGQDFECSLEKGELWFRYERKKCNGDDDRSVHKVGIKKVLYYMMGTRGEDFALVELKHKPKTKKFKSVKFDINPDAFHVGRKMVITGHPDDGGPKKLSLFDGPKGFGVIFPKPPSWLPLGFWQQPCKVTSISPDKQTFRYKCDTKAGNSGSPVLLADAHEPLAIGIHQAGGCNTSGGNLGTTSLAIWPKIQPILCPDNKSKCTARYLRTYYKA